MSFYPITPPGNPTFDTAVTPTSIAQVTDYQSRMLRRLIWQYQKAPRMMALISALAAEVQEAENAIWSIYTATLANATGDRLTQWGDIVGAPNPGATDDEYRGLIRAQAAAIRSSGGPEDYRRLLRGLASGADVKVREQFPLSVSLTYYDPIPISEPEWLAYAIRTARTATVSVYFAYTYDAAEFRFGSAVTGLGGSFGFSSAVSGGGFRLGGCYVVN